MKKQTSKKNSEKPVSKEVFERLISKGSSKDIVRTINTKKLSISQYKEVVLCLYSQSVNNCPEIASTEGIYPAISKLLTLVKNPHLILLLLVRINNLNLLSPIINTDGFLSALLDVFRKTTEINEQKIILNILCDLTEEQNNRAFLADIPGLLSDVIKYLVTTASYNDERSSLAIKFLHVFTEAEYLLILSQKPELFSCLKTVLQSAEISTDNKHHVLVILNSLITYAPQVIVQSKSLYDSLIDILLMYSSDSQRNMTLNKLVISILYQLSKSPIAQKDILSKRKTIFIGLSGFLSALPLPPKGKEKFDFFLNNKDLNKALLEYDHGMVHLEVDELSPSLAAAEDLFTTPVKEPELSLNSSSHAESFVLADHSTLMKQISGFIWMFINAHSSKEKAIKQSQGIFTFLWPHLVSSDAKQEMLELRYSSFLTPMNLSNRTFDNQQELNQTQGLFSDQILSKQLFYSLINFMSTETKIDFEQFNIYFNQMLYPITVKIETSLLLLIKDICTQNMGFERFKSTLHQISKRYSQENQATDLKRLLLSFISWYRGAKEFNQYEKNNLSKTKLISLYTLDIVSTDPEIAPYIFDSSEMSMLCAKELPTSTDLTMPSMNNQDTLDPVIKPPKVESQEFQKDPSSYFANTPLVSPLKKRKIEADPTFFANSTREEHRHKTENKESTMNDKAHTSQWIAQYGDVFSSNAVSLAKTPETLFHVSTVEDEPELSEEYVCPFGLSPD